MSTKVTSTATWVIQVFLGVTFLAQGLLKFKAPEGLPEPLVWVYDVTGSLAVFVGVVELLAAAGLLLPIIIKKARPLTPLAAGGLVPLMIGAAVWHVGRGEPIAQNIVLAMFAAGLAFLRRAWLKRADSQTTPAT